MPDAPVLRLETDECLTLSPSSERFKAAYQQIEVRRAEDVRTALGLSDAATKALHEHQCCRGAAAPAVVPRAEDLDSQDAATRYAARRAAYQALQAYVHSPTPGAFAYVKPTLDRYLAISKAIINSVLLGDIEVADGATLTISANTQVVNANRVIIHASGRIVCQGRTKFNVRSVEGVRTLSPVAVASVPVARIGR